MYTFSLLYITIPLACQLCQKPFHNISCCTTAKSNLKPIPLHLSFLPQFVCSFYAEILTVLAIMSNEMNAQEKKRPVFSGNLILRNRYIFRLLPVLAPTKIRNNSIWSSLFRLHR